jgi:hypothetical protein
MLLNSHLATRTLFGDLQDFLLGSLFLVFDLRNYKYQLEISKRNTLGHVEGVTYCAGSCSILLASFIFVPHAITFDAGFKVTSITLENVAVLVDLA